MEGGVSFSPETWQVLAGGLASLVAAFWGGVKWMAGRDDKKVQDARLHDLLDAERLKVEAAVAGQIGVLKDHMDRQESEIARLRANLELYIRHVGILEGMLRATGQEPPVSAPMGLSAEPKTLGSR